MLSDQPATKQDLLDLENRMKADRLQLEERLVGRLREMQSEFLRTFLNWARPTDVKLRGHEERLTLIEERLSRSELGSKPH